VTRSAHRFNHAGSTFHYELTVNKFPNDLAYVAHVWRDGLFFGIVQDAITRNDSAVARWSDVAVELIAVIHAERKIRGMAEVG
jgi:hypothetical protein